MKIYAVTSSYLPEAKDIPEFAGKYPVFIHNHSFTSQEDARVAVELEVQPPLPLRLLKKDEDALSLNWIRNSEGDIRAERDGVVYRITATYVQVPPYSFLLLRRSY